MVAKDVAVIVGCGGVGSNLAYLLSKEPSIKKIVLIDGDKVERKNLSRQFFTEQDIDEYKVKALKNSLNQFAPEKQIIASTEYLEREEDLDPYQKNIMYNNFYIFACTDNAKSKKIISSINFGNKLFIGCEEGITELRTYFNKGTWSLGDGYNSTQNFEGNMIGVFFAYIQYRIFVKTRMNFTTQDINTEKLYRLVTSNQLEPKYSDDNVDHTSGGVEI